MFSHNLNSKTTNPIFLNKKLDSIDNKHVKDLPYLQLYGKFDKTLYAICLRPFAEWNQFYYNEKLSLIELNEVQESYMLYKIPFNMLRNEKIKNNLVLLEDKNLVHLNPLNYELDTYNLCALFVNLKYDNLKAFCSQFTFNYKIDDFLKILLMNNYYSIELNPIMIKKVLEILENIQGYMFWSSESNTKINQTISFLSRQIDFSNINRLTDKEAKDVIEDIRNKKAEENDYLGYMYNSYSDLSSAIKKKGYSLYRLSDNVNNIKETIFDEFIERYINTLSFKNSKYDSNNNIYNTKEFFLIKIFENLLKNKDLCHLVLKSKFTPKRLYCNNKHETLFRYAFLTMKLEDCIKKSYAKIDDRHMFTLEQVNKLPSWFTYPEKVTTNPYFTFLVSDEVIDIKNNLLPVEFDGMVVDMKEYKRRFCIFLTGEPDFDPFKGFEYWDKFAVTGSINFAIIPRFNGILLKYYFNEKIKKLKYNNISLRKFLDISLKEYYCESTHYKNSDVDVMNNSKTWLEFFDDINKLKKIIDINTNKISNLNFTKSVCIIVNFNFINKYIFEYKEELIKDFKKFDNKELHIIQSMCNNINKYKQKIYEYYQRYQILENENNIDKPIFKDSFYNGYFKISNIDDVFILVKRTNLDWKKFFISINKKENPPVYISTCDKSYQFEESNMLCDININIKVKLSNSKLMKPLEIFRVKNSFTSTTNRFHVDPVRSFYMGKTKTNDERVIMHPTAIAGCKTGIVQYPKYFAGKRDYVEVVNNYHRRGIGVILNTKEKIHVLDYSFKLDKWKELYFRDERNKHIPLDRKIKLIFGTPEDKLIFDPIKKSYPCSVSYSYCMKNPEFRKWYKEVADELFNSELPINFQYIDYNNSGIADSIISKEGYLKKMK